MLYKPHNGIDIGGKDPSKSGEQIIDVIGGTVISNFKYSENMGNYIVIESPSIGSISKIYTYYYHLSSYTAGLMSGSTVTANQVIGKMDGTGNANGYVHLHFGVSTKEYGDYLDPLDFFNYR